MATPTLCDKNLWKEFALPAAESTSTNSGALELSNGFLGSDGVIDYPGEFCVTIPALTATICPNSKTVTVKIETSNDNFTNVVKTVILGTLTGSSGTPATTFKYRPVRDEANAIRAKIEFGEDCTDGSAVKALAYWAF